ncbi:hypothetical protein PHYBOEH_010504 [Phytophthora boehmeriae]|uniref:Uncharacterized protein n=1 Tax=Phytophthora boehmeriae TaxID=109152 RepID=A0A8T1WZQ4_9STRA|nr:hypothetical protein PHYBOEH_010504 [Phytophthora boehmeriae]
MDAEEVGAAEELLLQQRALIDRSLHPLEEDAPLDELLRHFHHLILNLKHQEPSFWQLNVVEFIRKALKTRVGDRILAVVKEAAKNSPEDPTDVVTSALARTKQSEELEETLQHLQQQIEAEITRLTEVLNTEEEDHCQLSDSGEHFLERFWTKLQHSATTGGAQPGDDGERGSEDAEEIEDSSFDMLTFDDDLDEISRSAMSFPCLEDFPATICKMQSADGQDRTAGLDELMQVVTLLVCLSDLMV